MAAPSAASSASTARPSGSTPLRPWSPPGRRAIDLPPRLSLFGLTRLPASHLSVLEAVAVWRDVHLLLLHPSGTVVGQGRFGVPRPPSGIRRADDPTASVPANPLLRSWGRDAREMQLILSARGPVAGEYRSVAESSPSLLHRIQADFGLIGRLHFPPIRRTRSPAAARPRRPQPEGSLVPWALPPGGGDARRRPPLAGRRPHPRAPGRDHYVPRYETFAPLVHAAFGEGDRTGPATTPTMAVRLTRRRRVRAGATNSCPLGRPVDPADQSVARGGGLRARAGRQPGHRLTGARPGVEGTGAAPLPAR